MPEAMMTIDVRGVDEVKQALEEADLTIARLGSTLRRLVRACEARDRVEHEPTGHIGAGLDYANALAAAQHVVRNAPPEGQQGHIYAP
jgi:hypothetical protein